jgi:hypothetical protein
LTAWPLEHWRWRAKYRLGRGYRLDLPKTLIGVGVAALRGCVYFKTLESELSVTLRPGERKKSFEKGLRHYFTKAFNVPWSDCPANIDIVEQIILVRNRDQHPDHIATLQVSHDRRTRENYGELFFVSETEMRMFADPDMAGISWMNPTVHVSHEGLLAAIQQVEILSEWLESRTAIKHRR